MHYISTRGQAEQKTFTQLLVSGAASDGGLYMPATWPQLSTEEIAGLADQPYAEVAAVLINKFTGGTIAFEQLRQACGAVYVRFDHKDVCPLIELSPNFYLLELFHGPTFAFKDIAMQLLAHLIKDELQTRHNKTTIICATSGDTGAAAVAAFAEQPNVDVVVLFPQNCISDVQRKQITASGARNVISIAVEGSFDDAQGIVKELFADQEFAARHRLASVNSINWVRIAAQVPYYFTATLKVETKRPISFCVPTGNFGDIFAGYAAKKMGLAISRLIVATNQNDILARTLQSGIYQVGDVMPTTSPSMDIQISSNFERLLFEASNRSGAAVREMMEALRKEGRFSIPLQTLENIKKDFAASSASEAEVITKIRDVHARTGRFIDPHTAVALVVATKAGRANETTIVLSTAHAAKFPQSIKDATGAFPPQPEPLAALMKKGENYTVLPPNTAKVRAYLQRNL